jgi:hypothetical protein
MRQGDGLSCPLFLISKEPLAQTINKDKGVKGARMPGAPPTKQTGYADDAVYFCYGNSDVVKILGHVHTHERASGAKVNKDKSM